MQLTWKDVSYNETGFKIYRSVTQASGYTLINTVAANSTSYLDTSAKGNTQYYYKILASNTLWQFSLFKYCRHFNARQNTAH